MGVLATVRGRWRGSLGCLLVAWCVAGTVALGARPQGAWERAIADRAAFEASGDKSKAGYERMLNEFRAVYHQNPAAVHAAGAVYAVAELLAEQGRATGDARSLRAAVGQYEFLRVQYPASGLRAQALLAEGEVEDKDLGEPGVARGMYAGVVKEAPRSAAAGEARAALTGLTGGSASHTDASAGGTAESHVPARRSAAGDGVRRAEPAVAGLALTEENARRVEAESSAPAGGRPEATAVPAALIAAETAAPTEPVVTRQPSRAKRPDLAQVTAIRHWSTASYTRVAIDLGAEVTFEAARVPHPDRIYFDLHGARLGQELVGRSFDVTDDGFLKKIRAAQSSADVTRVVLDVNDVTEFSAFLLPNPYRLIIDIHGARTKNDKTDQAASRDERAELAETPVGAAAVRQASVAASHSGLPAMAPTDGSALASSMRDPGPAPVVRADAVPAPRTGLTLKPTAARPVPNTVTVKAPATTTEVAAVSETPGRVDATHAPTSKPVVAVVAKTAAAPDGTPEAANRSLPRSRKGATADAVPARAADKTADGETSLIRALGLKIGRIVIDAGHGGHDSGTLGVGGIEEKDVVLDVALRLGKLLHERLGAEIIYTRSDDTFIPLETRTAIANKAQADLFLSIHANSSQDESARGVEVYYLNFTSDPTALDVAARENAVSGSSVHQLSDLVKKITLKDKIAESREFAADVDASLYAGLAKGNEGLKNRGTKKAPFVVLIGANMPSILAEISFVTNGKDAAQLREPDYRERVAESLYSGVARYEAGLAGSKPVPAVRAAVK